MNMALCRLVFATCLLTTALAISPSQLKLQHSISVHSREYTPEAEKDRVDQLPGAPNALDFGLFSGYITVDDAAGRALFYIFAEARSDSENAPLLLWLNGGPGCSSIGGGFMSELGPYYPRKDGKTLQDNPYSWNNVANVLWLESPAFVGFSYSNTSADAIVGDARTAVDARMFLLHWLKRFPQYADRDFYISGESYGGHYVPNLAWEIVQGNRRAEEAASAEGVAVSPGKGYINLQGFFVGNAWTDAYTDNKGALDYWWYHAMISDESYQAVRENCDFNIIGPLMRGSEALTLPGTHSSSERSDDKDMICAKWLDIAFAEQGGINIYQIYADTCPRETLDFTAAISSSRTKLSAENGRKYRGALLGSVSPLQSVASRADSSDNINHPRHGPRYDPCIDNEVERYLNLPEVQEALHANQTVKLPWRWSDCTRMISYSREDLLSSMLPTYRKLLNNGLKIWVFSGDVDGIVPVVGSRRWTSGLNLPVVKPWRPWNSKTGQVGGWRVDYQGLTFATVRNAGHMVPYVQPERGYYLLKQFLFEDRPEPNSMQQ